MEKPNQPRGCYLDHLHLHVYLSPRPRPAPWPKYHADRQHKQYQCTQSRSQVRRQISSFSPRPLTASPSRERPPPPSTPPPWSRSPQPRFAPVDVVQSGFKGRRAKIRGWMDGWIDRRHEEPRTAAHKTAVRRRRSTTGVAGEGRKGQVGGAGAAIRVRLGAHSWKHPPLAAAWENAAPLSTFRRRRGALLLCLVSSRPFCHPEQRRFSL